MKKFLLVMAMVFMFVFGACAAQPTKADSGSIGQTNFGTFSSGEGVSGVQEFVDANTGVHYIVVTAEARTNFGDSCSVSITPRLKADGTLYCSWKGNKK